MRPAFRTSWTRFSVAAGLMLIAGIFLVLRSRAEVVPPHKVLAEFPKTVGDRMALRDETMSAEELAVLGPGDFMVRNYLDLSNRQPWVSLYIAYFQSQRTGDTIHSPKNCLPGAGWTPVQVDRVTLQRPEGPATVNRYILANGGNKLLALYWYQAHGRIVASEYSAKIYLVADAMRLNRTDGSLVRIMTPVEDSDFTMAAAQRRVTDFAANVTPLLDQYIPR